MHLQPQILQAENATIAYLNQGAQLVGWTPSGQGPVLWVAREAKWIENLSVRGGVPICFPWFGVGRSPREMKHGTVRLANWTKVAAEARGGDAYLEMTCRGETETEGQFQLTYRVTAGAQLKMELEIHNPSQTVLDVEAALHTYFAVPDVTQTQISGLDGAVYDDTVPGQVGRKTQSGPVKFCGPTDRIYYSDATLEASAGERTYRIEQTGGGVSVIWNPWEEGAKQMQDFGDQEWRTMFCAEAACARERAVQIAPGQSHTLTQTVSLIS